MGEHGNGRISAYFEIIRPKQWYKNLLLFVGVAFAKKIGDAELVIYATVGFLAFCALSGAVYILNDIVDRERDKAHPRKSKRPIPSGRISVPSAAVYGVLIGAAGVIGAIWLGELFLLSSLAYLTISVTYSFYFKNLVILDALAVAAGFVVRALAGAVAVDVPVSPWLVICVFLLAMFLTFGKRRHEIALLGEEAENHREILKHYSLHMVEDMMTVSTATLIMAYSMYTFLATNQYMMLTIPFAIYGLLRYTFLVHMAGEGGEPELIFKDIPTVLNLLCWMAAAFLILYYAPGTGPILGG